MKKEKITQYDETNFTKSPLYKKYKRRRRKEVFCRFISLPTVLWTIGFLIISSGFLLLSYFVYESNPWLSGVLVSIACGIITGVTLYFLSNLRNNKLHALQIEQDEIYPFYESVHNVFLGENLIVNSRNLGTYNFTDEEAAKTIMDRLIPLSDAFNGGNIIFFDQKEGLENFYKDVSELCESYHMLNNDDDRQKWISDVINRMSPIKRKMELLMEENRDQIRFIKKYFF